MDDLVKNAALNFYPKNARMVPDGLQPKCHKMHITVKEVGQKTASGKNSAKKKSTAQQITSKWDYRRVHDQASRPMTRPQAIKEQKKK